MPDAARIARKLAPFVLALCALTWAAACFAITYHVALALFFHRVPA